jgi:asparagine synthase (glutamine-hydrolysing)
MGNSRYFAFASEVVPLLALGDKRPPLNERRLAMLGVSAMSTCLEPETTCFETIFRVPAATVLSVEKGGIKISEYWQPDAKKRLHFKSDAECAEAFQEVFLKAVKARLRSAFPVASLLSGGLDSSGIVAAASKILADQNRSLITLSAVPMPAAQGQVVDEREYIDLFKDRPNLSMRYVSAPGRGPFDDLGRLVQTTRPW